mmetsp:Transcript_20443/g.50090  ORF Transcript_20443/g.50090 Transcript_20443/m.50090 type:complete len:510 (+) Transcript_20443:158-1687(+)
MGEHRLAATEQEGLLSMGVGDKDSERSGGCARLGRSGRLRELERWQLLALTGAMCGVQTCYAVQIGHGSATLAELGLPEAWLSYAWIAGPTSGIIVQPLVGAASDSCRLGYGRRRPFLVVGTILTSLALILFGNAEGVGRFFAGEEGGTALALAIAVVGFFLLDFSIQAIQGPLRALLTDVVPPSQQAQGNSYFALMVGLGNLLGSALGAVNLKSLFGTKSDIQALFALAALILIATVVVCCVSVPEEPLQRLENDSQAPNDSRGSDLTLRMLLRTAPKPFWRVFTVQCFTWYGFFTLFIYATVWVGENVFLGEALDPVGTPGRTLYERGVKLGNVGLALNAVVTVLYATTLPAFLRLFGTRSMYGFSQTVEACLLASAVLIRGTEDQTQPSKSLQFVTLLSLAFMGVAWASTMTIPWALMGTAVQSKYPTRVGLMSTIFNLSQSGPQLFVSFGAPLIVRATNDVSYVMLVGGLFAAVGAVLVFLLKVDEFDPEVDPNASADSRESLLD